MLLHIIDVFKVVNITHTHVFTISLEISNYLCQTCFFMSMSVSNK